jgi:hypothetical protein
MAIDNTKGKLFAVLNVKTEDPGKLTVGALPEDIHYSAKRSSVLPIPG